MVICDKCSRHKLTFNRPYAPNEFIEGNPKADVWIIGLNPKEEPKSCSSEDLHTALDDETNRHPYFKDFAKVSLKLKLNSRGNVAHTDLVKCHSGTWLKSAVAKREVIKDCIPYLSQQLNEHLPRVIVCNGADVSREIRKIILPSSKLASNETQYDAEFHGRTVTVILSGFIGRLDNFAKRRLGREIEEALDKRLELPACLPSPDPL